MRSRRLPRRWPPTAARCAWHAANAGDAEQAEACVGGDGRAIRFGRHPGQQRRDESLLRSDHRHRTFAGPKDRAREPRGRSQLDAARLACVDARARRGRAQHLVGRRAVGGAGIGWYNVTKAAVAHLTRQMAGELGPRSGSTPSRRDSSGPTSRGRCGSRPGTPWPGGFRSSGSVSRRTSPRRPLPGLGRGIVDNRPRARDRRGSDGRGERRDLIQRLI